MSLGVKKIEVESAGDGYVVRCVEPPSPPFKSSEFCKTVNEAAVAVADMLNFPEHENIKVVSEDGQ